jgi:YegS/Rv2252/BmrU family lipid kinase
MLQDIGNALLIYNPAAGRLRGRLRPKLDAALAALGQCGIRAELAETTGPGSATHLARRAAEERRGLVLVCGGDGTINEAVNGLAGSGVPLAVLPGGTANVLAKELDLPRDLRHAARLLPAGVPRRIALGLAVPDDASRPPRYFVCLAGAGPDAALVRGVSLRAKERVGILAFWLEGMRLMFTYPFPGIRAACEERETRATLVVLGRTQHYGGPVRITTQASLFEDCFEVLAVTTDSRLRYAANLMWLLAGLHRGRKENQFWKTARLRCEPAGCEPVYAQVDGELIGELPVEFRIVPDALTLVVRAGGSR